MTLGEGTAEVAHEVLIREWPTLRGWLDEDREGIRLHRQLGDAARLWEAGGRETVRPLPRRPARGRARAGRRTPAPQLNATERAFLDDGRQAGERERRAPAADQPPPARAAGRRRTCSCVALVAGAVALRPARQRAAGAGAARRTPSASARWRRTETNSTGRCCSPSPAGELQDRVETRGDLLPCCSSSPALVRFGRPSRTLITARRGESRRPAAGDGDTARKWCASSTSGPGGGRAGRAARRRRSPAGDGLLPRRPHARRWSRSEAATGRACIWSTRRRAGATGRRRGASIPASIGSSVHAAWRTRPTAGGSPLQSRRRVAGLPGPSASDRRCSMRPAAHASGGARYPMRPARGRPHVAFTARGCS